MSGLDNHTRKILEVRLLLKQRDIARSKSQYVKADEIRNNLINNYGVDIIDQGNGLPSGFKFRDKSSKKIPNNIKIPPELDINSVIDKDDIDHYQKSIAGNKRKNDREEKVPFNSKKVNKGTSDESNRNNALMKSLLGSEESHRMVQGVTIEDLKNGSGTSATTGKRIKVNYIGKLKSTGKVFDSSLKKPFTFRLGRGEVIRGWDVGCLGMTVGGKRRLTIPPEKAYGKSGAPPTIPPNATLVFEISLLEVK